MVFSLVDGCESRGETGHTCLPRRTHVSLASAGPSGRSPITECGQVPCPPLASLRLTSHLCDLMLRLLLAAAHLLALAIGFRAVLYRSAALGDAPGDAMLRRVFRADSWWGLAALLWVSTGLWRWLAELEKTRAYYRTADVFHLKLGLFALVFLLELWPMVTLVRWRIARGRGAAAAQVVVPASARRIATIGRVQALLLVAIVVAAVATARGFSLRG
jgi:putative membrane protein